MGVPDSMDALEIGVSDCGSEGCGFDPHRPPQGLLDKESFLISEAVTVRGDSGFDPHRPPHKLVNFHYIAPISGGFFV